MYLDEATAAIERGDPESALNLCELVLNLDPSQPRACYIAAECYRLLRFLEEAEQYFRLSIQRDASFSPSLGRLGAVLFDQLRFEEAGAAFTAQFTAIPRIPRRIINAHYFRERKSDASGAARDYGRAYRIDPHAYPKPVSLEKGDYVGIE